MVLVAIYVISGIIFTVKTSQILLMVLKIWIISDDALHVIMIFCKGTGITVKQIQKYVLKYHWYKNEYLGNEIGNLYTREQLI